MTETNLNVKYSPTATLAETIATLEQAGQTPAERWALKILKQCREDGHAWICEVKGLQVAVPSVFRKDENGPMFKSVNTKPRRALMLWANPGLLETGEALQAVCGNSRCHRPACQQSTGYTTRPKGSSSSKKAAKQAPRDVAGLAIEWQRLSQSASESGFDLARGCEVYARLHQLGVDDPFSILGESR